jgi:hypothetical protein
MHPIQFFGRVRINLIWNPGFKALTGTLKGGVLQTKPEKRGLVYKGVKTRTLSR